MIEELQTKTEHDLLENIFQQILIISKGDCQITDETLARVHDERYFNILSGLQMLHEDLALYKKEFKAKIEAEFQLAVLKKRNEELAQFNYVASHDLQEPLRTIKLFADLLLKNNFEQLDADGKIHLQFIKESSSRMSELIQGLLNYSIVGKSNKFESVDCTQLIKVIIKDFSSIILETKPIFEIGNLPVVYGDKTHLRQVFQNLIGNALKFKKENTPIQLKISVDSSTDDHVFCFEDNGIGIEEEYLQKIFGIFQRLHSKTEFEGTGIGLALCKKIIEMHNGKIWVESNKVSGSKFFVLLPKS